MGNEGEGCADDDGFALVEGGLSGCVELGMFGFAETTGAFPGAGGVVCSAELVFEFVT